MTSTPHIIDALHDLDRDLDAPFDPGENTPQPDNTPPPEPEAPARRQPGVEVEVFLEGQEPYRVRITNRDRIDFELTAAKHKEWPVLDYQTGQNQHFALTFQTWTAARRAGRTEVNFERWKTLLLDYDVIKPVPADPTR